MRISELVYPSDHLVLQQFFHSTSIVKSIWGPMPLEVIFPEYARSRFIRLIVAPHIRRDHITIIYIFKNLYYVMSPTNLTCRIYETFFPFHWTQFNHFVKIAKLNSQSRPGWRLSRYGDFIQCGIQKKSPHHLRPRNGGVWFLFKPAGYSRDRRGIFNNGAGYRRDTGRVSQLLGT